MNATLLSIRTVRRSSIMVLGALALAACDTDRSVGPSTNAVATPKNVNGAVLGTSARRAAWDVRDITGTLVGGSVFRWNDGTGEKLIADNSALDLDPTPGRFEVSTPNGNSGICPKTAPSGFVFPAPLCYGIPIPPGGTTFVTSFAVFPEYSISWSAAGTYGPVGPAVYSVKGKTVRLATTIADNAANDRDNRIGQVVMILQQGGDYEVCMTKAAPDTKLDTTCFKTTVKFGEPAFAGVFYSPTDDSQ